MKEIVKIRKHAFLQYLKIEKDIKTAVLPMKITFITFLKILKCGFTKIQFFYKIDPRFAPQTTK